MRNSSFFLYRLLVPVKFSYRDTKLLIDRFPRDVPQDTKIYERIMYSVKLIIHTYEVHARYSLNLRLWWK